MSKRAGLSLLLVITALGLFISLTYQDAAQALEKALTEGALALCLISAFRFFPLGLDGWAWSRLLPKSNATPSVPFYHIWLYRWIGESINTLLPVGQIGGDFARARLLAQKDESARLLAQKCTDARLLAQKDEGDKTETAPFAGASVLIDFVLGLVTQAVFTLMGVTLIFVIASEAVELGPLAAAITFSLIIAIGLWKLISGNSFPQIAEKMTAIAPKGKLANLSGGLQQLHQQMQIIFAAKKALYQAILVKTAAWVCRSFEIWIILYCLQMPVDFQTAIIIESVASAIRSAAFLIPGAIGVQDGAIILLCHWLGLPAEAGLLIAILKRGREIVTSLPGLLVWLIMEGKIFLPNHTKRSNFRDE